MSHLNFSQVASNEEIIAAFPAYIIKRRQASNDFKSKGLVVLKAGERLGLLKERNGKVDYYKEFSINSVASYALEKDSCPIAAYEKAVKNKHALYWINSSGACLSSVKRAPEFLVEISVGMRVWFEGHAFEIVKEPNDNLGLKKLTVEPPVQ